MAHLDMTVGSDTSQALSMARKIGIRDTQGALAKGGRWKSDGASTAGEINGTLFRRGGTFPRTTLWLYGRSDSLIAVALDGVSLKRIVGSMPAGQSSMSNARCTPRRSRLCAPTANSSSGRGAPRIEARRAGAHAPGARLSEAGRKGELPISEFVCFGAEAKTLGDYAALDDEATGDEIHGEFRRRRRNAGRGKAAEAVRAKRKRPGKAGRLEIQSGMSSSDLGRIDLGEAAMKLPEPCPRPLLTDRDDPVLQHARL